MAHHQFTGWAQTWHDDTNTTNRLLAIRNFGKAMLDPAKWKQSWVDGGGTSGILHLLSLASVTEVKAFCYAVRASNRRGRKSGEREGAVEELVMALLPQQYPSTELRTRDKRPLQKFYGHMLRGCSSDFVESVLEAQDKSNPLFQKLNLKKLISTHGDMLKRRLTNYLVHEGPQLPESEMDIIFRAFVFREPPYPGTQPHMSASMQFALELLHARLTLKCTAERWPREVSEIEVLMSVYRRLARRSRSADKISLIKLGLQLIELRPDSKLSWDAGVLWTAVINLWKRHPSRYEDLLSQGIRLGLRGSNTILAAIATRWKEDPDQYEQLLVQSLLQELGGSAKKISEGYIKTIGGMPRTELGSELRWRLLRLYCQYVPEKGIDIETSSDFKCLANQEWSFEVVDKIERERATPFLTRLYEFNPNFDFLLPPTPNRSIYSMRKVPRRNFNVELLLTAYRQGDADVQRKARDEVDQLRKKAATSREQEDRALYAKASAHYAIATGDLEVYAETVLWQQRFVRDPLTVQSIFTRDAILTSEGIALLSGINLPPGEDTTLSIISQRLKIANQILKSFDEARRMAMKEPSYKQSSWAALQSLYGDVYHERVSRAKKVKLQPDESDLDMFHIIWEGTADLVHSIGSDFLSQVSGAVINLLDGFSGPSLIAASEILLDAAAKWGKKEGRNKDQETISATMENLTYRVVSKLAYSDTPMLARDLIRRVIIEHPEASSWHRQFLSISYMRDLPAQAAKTMLLSFSAAIGEKLEEQSYVKVGDEEPAKSAPPRSLIKVSTVKYLAQLLNDADFISPDSAIEVLIELFKSATHIDVRIATLDSLFSTLSAILADSGEKWRSHPMVERILTTLDSIIPIAGDVNERRPISTTDWAEAKEKTTIPATSDNSTIPPLFEMILNVTAGKQFLGLKKLQGDLFSRLLLPTLHHSQEQHRQWFSLFLNKHSPALNADILPRVPITPRIWHYMLNHLGHILPSTIIDEYNQFIRLRLRMPKDIKDLNKALQDNATLRNDASVSHWLSIFGDPGQSRCWHGEINSILDLVVAPIEKATPVIHLMSIVVSQASVLLDDYENHIDKWSHLVTSLGPTRMRPSLSGQGGNSYNEEMEKAWAYWHEATSSLAQRLIALIQQNAASSAARDNAVLPSTFPLRLWCLPYPDPRATHQDTGFRHLAVALERCLSSFLESGEGEVLLWTTLVDDTYTTLASMYTSTTNCLYAAVHVGDLDLLGVDTHGAAVGGALSQRGVLRKLKVNGKGKEEKKEKDSAAEAERVRFGELVKGLRAVMERWGRPGGQAPCRDMFLRWKGENEATWEDIRSWGSIREEA
ncbi:hypothetical protein O1611_g5531 [Lasiodiplodia mahajangana]|uniref:Uncharacterized protein n=1 Tax=Lasiodiplodia mahajangana TaxID=1108764 RepID=A0ACC2JKQ9_9PEZI|nr:hypothetical protein O1611_g5531 [Lasiodiplodia mahajangana]